MSDCTVDYTGIIFHNLLNLRFIRTKDDDCLSLAKADVADPLRSDTGVVTCVLSFMDNLLINAYRDCKKFLLVWWMWVG